MIGLEHWLVLEEPPPIEPAAATGDGWQGMAPDVNAANVSLVAFNKYMLPGADGAVSPDGQVMVFFTIAVAAAEVAVALVIAMLLFRRLDTVNVDDVANLRW